MMRRLLPLLLFLPTPVMAELPPPGCYARSYDAAHLAAHPEQGVAGLRLWYFTQGDAGDTPAALVEARMAMQGQAARDGVAGRVLSQYAICDAQGACYVECDGGLFTTEVTGDGGLRLSTERFRVGEGDSCGGSSDLAERDGQTTLYQLVIAPAEACESLWRPHPLPAPGCYGVTYSDSGHGQGLLGMRLYLRAPDSGFTFPQAEGTFRVTLPDSGRARAAGMGGARIAVPIWCSARDGYCRSGIDEGALMVVPMGEDALALETSRFVLYGAEAANIDIALPGPAPTRHQLQRMPPDACRGME
ncbi:hypothetical protein [Pararhodobacter sp.]|uniref:hypothetical protein n=1 Tax=Pararhodobacter sp. TaxID=2127056 RepID=UPI002AFFDC12|nr:hypothetical protein [Pararhodobacter sp.]